MTSYEHDPMYLLKLKNIQGCIQSASEFIDQIVKNPQLNIDPKFSNLRSLLQDVNSLIDNYSDNKKCSVKEEGQFLGYTDPKCPNCGDIVKFNPDEDKHCRNCGCQFKSR